MRRVMISDPHPAARQMLVRMAARLGYEPVVVGSTASDAGRSPEAHSACDARRSSEARSIPGAWRALGAHAVPEVPRSPEAHQVSDAHPTPARLRSADVLLIEPTSPGGLTLVRTARAANPTLTVVGQGALPPGRREQDRWRRVAQPVGHLAKPFTSAQLDAVLQQSFAHRDHMTRRASHAQAAARSAEQARVERAHGDYRVGS